MTSCSICLELLESEATGEYRIKSLIECGHRFHTVCINQWLINTNSCPLCRTLILRDDDITIIGETNAFNVETEHQVHRILNRRLNRRRNNRVEYLIQWVGFRNPTWEPLANCLNCLDLIVEYEETERDTARRYIYL